jgi:hypothetical protein
MELILRTRHSIKKIGGEEMIDKVKPNEPQCPESCCSGTELVCVSIPCPINIVLLGGLLNINLDLRCLKIESNGELTPDEMINILQTLSNLLGGLVGSLQTTTQQ